MEVVQTYSAAGAAQADQMLKGAPEGWRQTLDKLEAEVARMHAAPSAPSSMAPFISSAPMTRRPKRCTGRCPTRRPRAAGSSGPQGWRLIERTMDFRVGGRERVKGGFDGGVTTTFDAVYHDIVPRERHRLHL